MSWAVGYSFRDESDHANVIETGYVPQTSKDHLPSRDIASSTNPDKKSPFNRGCLGLTRNIYHNSITHAEPVYLGNIDHGWG